jgi:uncharacterized protein YneF (UPF0154 family)
MNISYGTWQFVWTFIVQPVILFGLFTMTFISMFVAIRSFKKQLKADEEEIQENSADIKKLYSIVKEHLKAGKDLQRTLQEEEFHPDFY